MMGQTGRADLLLALRHGGADAVTLDQTDTHWMGYRVVPVAREVEVAVPHVAIDIDAGALAPTPPVAGRDALRPIRLPLKMPSAWVLESYTQRDLAQELRGVPALRAADLEPQADHPVPYQDLVPWARATPALKRTTARWVDAGVDWPKLAGLLARQALPRRLPMRRTARWPAHLVLALDFSPRLEPYYWDLHRLGAHLSAQMDRSSLSVRAFERGPPGAWRPWRHPRQPTRSGAAFAPRDWPRLSPGTVVLVASDLGLFDAQPDVHADWLQWGRDLVEQGCRVVALAPVGASQPTAKSLRVFELLRWSPDSRWRRETAPGGETADGLVQSLLALAATALRIDPPLLREWRSLLPGGGDAGLEGKLWNHAHIEQATLTCALKQEHVDDGLARHAELPTDLRQAAHRARTRQHDHLRKSMNSAEDLRWAAAQGDEGHDPSGEQPLRFIKRLLRGLEAGEDLSEADRRALLGTATLVQAAAAPRVRAQDPALFAAIDACIARLRQGAVAAATGSTVAPTRWVLAQQRESLRMLSADDETPVQHLAAPAELAADRPDAVWVESKAKSSWLPLAQQGPVLAHLGQGVGTVRATMGVHHWAVAEEARPYWAEAWAWQDGRLTAQAHAPNGELLSFARPFESQRTSCADGRFTATVDAHGLVGEVTLATNRNAPLLRLRLIPAGTFMMGSPDGVGGSDEHPQHPVTLSQPFWLAETPCTQALWTAVMGKNPSDFVDGKEAPQRPVENVSWDDVQTFLRKLEPMLPAGCQAFLPSEGQWEYAARASTTTAYAWGDDAQEGRANWNQEHKGTTPVGRYPANRWGLMDMHGNVWEWCADDLRTYAFDAAFDPSGPLGEGLSARVVRGGSWFFLPGRARSAFRGGGHPGDRGRGLGFRLALRSSSPEAGGQVLRPGGTPGGAGRPADVPGLADRLRSALGLGSKKKRKPGSTR